MGASFEPIQDCFEDRRLNHMATMPYACFSLESLNELTIFQAFKGSAGYFFGNYNLDGNFFCPRLSVQPKNLSLSRSLYNL